MLRNALVDSGHASVAGRQQTLVGVQVLECRLPGPPMLAGFLEVFGFIKATKKQPFGGAGGDE